MDTKHGYVRYTKGCRCEECRYEWAAYMRDFRARTKEQANPLVSYTRDCAQAVDRATALVKRRTDEIMNWARNPQDNTSTSSDIENMSMTDWAQERGKYVKTRDARAPGQDIF